MVKQMLWEAGVVIAVLGGVTSGLTQEKPSPPPKAEGKPAARKAEEDTPKQKVAKRRLAKLEALLKNLERPERKDRVEDKGPGQANAPGPMTRASQTCLICRLTRVETTSAKQTTTKYEENECSRWYAANVQPHHTHVWENSTCVYTSDSVVGLRASHVIPDITRSGC
jgi:hypothetical protein